MARTLGGINLIVLILVVWGEIADYRYILNGGKRSPKLAQGVFLAAVALLLVLLFILGSRGMNANSIGKIAGTTFLFLGAVWELYRAIARRA